MPGSPTRPSRSIAALKALCELGLHADVLVPAVLEALHAVVPSERNLFDWTDERGRLLRYCIEGPLDVQIAQLYFDEFHNRRESEVMPRFDTLPWLPMGVCGADEGDHPGFYRSALYHEIWRPQGFHTRLEAVLRGRGGRLLGSLVLYRGTDDPRFSPQDRHRLAAVLPALADGLEAGADAVADERHVPSPEPPQTLLLTLQGQVCHASPGAHRLLLMAQGGASRQTLCHPLDQLVGGLLPSLLVRLRERAQHPSTGSATTLPALACASHTGSLVATATLLGALHAAQAPLVQLTLHRLEPHRVALERALRALPLTAGQAAVCRGLYLGRSHGQVGQQLGVALATVVDHVRKVYRALDVRSALELRARVDACIGAC